MTNQHVLEMRNQTVLVTDLLIKNRDALAMTSRGVRAMTNRGVQVTSLLTEIVLKAPNAAPVGPRKPQ